MRTEACEGRQIPFPTSVYKGGIRESNHFLLDPARLGVMTAFIFSYIPLGM
jgi:hypothetical protein